LFHPGTTLPNKVYMDTSMDNLGELCTKFKLRLTSQQRALESFFQDPGDIRDDYG